MISHALLNACFLLLSSCMLLFIDVNECTLDTDECDTNAYCTKGSYNCTCNDGYAGDGFNCTGIIRMIKTSSLVLRYAMGGFRVLVRGCLILP